ncbi:hypothetical protein NE852_31520 (plasmid) [Rhizobium sp. Pop5]|uniref:hypothetical protein n=1 Tax=Rhizobium sp. Pop5 TaxID=1223565 RepID=UPI000283CCD2|nr:hypothetical protein [Rhizobium sp. Pop5]EJZ18455.1 hypothetical protein RCCGEPOP_25547 [Rhizobium sp. Pop5]UVD60299.1 hypothetical protein NE852_31520 [Rhizobium sp. Pop5]
MTENVVSFEEKRLEVLSGTIFGSTAEERNLAAIRSNIEFARNELALVQNYIDLAYDGDVVVTMNDGTRSEPEALAHLGSVLSNYEQALFDKIGSLEYELEMLEFPPDQDEE